MKSKVNPDQRSSSVAAHSPLEHGRECFQRRAWLGAWQALSLADQQTRLDGADLERLALSAYLLGRDEEYLDALDRAHSAHRSAGENLPAVRCAFWLGFRLLMRGETGRANGWLARAQRLLERQQHECAERGYLLLPLVEQQLDAGDFETAYATAASAALIGERCADADLIAR